MHTSLDIKNPGLRTLPPGVERYYVKGGGLSVIEVSPEDKIEIINDEGKQTCEIIVFNSKGKRDLSILNLKENSNANFSKKTISISKKLEKKGFYVAPIRPPSVPPNSSRLRISISSCHSQNNIKKLFNSLKMFKNRI